MPSKKKEAVKDPAISKLGEKADESFVPFGIPELDGLTGGIPRGRITEIWGQEGVGKTHTVSRIMVANSDKKILVIDSEFALNKGRVADLGANVDNIDFIQDSRLERVCELLISSVGAYDIIILDSLAYLTPTTVDTAEVGENAIGLFARQVKHWVVKFRPRLGISKTAFVVVNQYRKPFGMYVKAEPPGGTAFNHAVDVRLFLSSNSGDKVMDGPAQTGHNVHVEVRKSKVSQPFLKTKFLITYPVGEKKI